jgi:predicted metal-dependent HD superfamily phosphohydrolase
MAQHDALLHARWRTALGALCTCDSAAADEALDMVLARHREPHRHYHGDIHVARVVDAVHELAAATDTGDVDEHLVVVAAVFHDAIYEPTSATNEADSADLAARVLGDLGVNEASIDKVRSLIIATSHHYQDHHDPDGIDGDTAVLLDADLSVLGADPAAYQSYVEGVRAEYSHVDDGAWVTGRLQVVDALLARDPLFITPEGRRRWEARARANLTAERHQLLHSRDP